MIPMTEQQEHKAKRGRKPLPEEAKRVAINCKVSPVAFRFLTSLGETNHGRAVDKLVTQHLTLKKRKRSA